MSWSRLKNSKTSKYAIVVIAIAIVALAIWILLPPREVTIAGIVTINGSRDPLNHRPVPVYIRFIDVNSSAVYEYLFSSFRITYLGSAAEYSQKVPNGQTYRVEIGWSVGNSSGMWIAGTYSFDQPAGQPTNVTNFVVP